MNESERTIYPDRIFPKRTAIYDDIAKEMGFASLKEYHKYIDRGVELLTRILVEAGNAVSLEFKDNLITNPNDPNAGEDWLKIEKNKNYLIVGITNPKNNNYELGSISFTVIQEKTQNPFGSVVAGEFDTPPDWNLLRQISKDQLDRVYKVLEYVLQNQLHKREEIKPLSQTEQPKLLE